MNEHGTRMPPREQMGAAAWVTARKGPVVVVRTRGGQEPNMPWAPRPPSRPGAPSLHPAEGVCPGHRGLPCCGDPVLGLAEASPHQLVPRKAVGPALPWGRSPPLGAGPLERPLSCCAGAAGSSPRPSVIRHPDAGDRGEGGSFEQTCAA